MIVPTRCFDLTTALLVLSDSSVLGSSTVLLKALAAGLRIEDLQPAKIRISYKSNQSTWDLLRYLARMPQESSRCQKGQTPSGTRDAAGATDHLQGVQTPCVPHDRYALTSENLHKKPAEEVRGCLELPFASTGPH